MTADLDSLRQKIGWETDCTSWQIGEVLKIVAKHLSCHGYTGAAVFLTPVQLPPASGTMAADTANTEQSDA